MVKYKFDVLFHKSWWQVLTREAFSNLILRWLLLNWIASVFADSLIHCLFHCALGLKTETHIFEKYEFLILSRIFLARTALSFIRKLLKAPFCADLGG